MVVDERHSPVVSPLRALPGGLQASPVEMWVAIELLIALAVILLVRRGFGKVLAK
jgi:hypothetical protein